MSKRTYVAISWTSHFRLDDDFVLKFAWLLLPRRDRPAIEKVTLLDTDQTDQWIDTDNLKNSVAVVENERDRNQEEQREEVACLLVKILGW